MKRAMLRNTQRREWSSVVELDLVFHDLSWCRGAACRAVRMLTVMDHLLPPPKASHITSSPTVARDAVTMLPVIPSVALLRRKYHYLAPVITRFLQTQNVLSFCSRQELSF